MLRRLLPLVALASACSEVRPRVVVLGDQSATMPSLRASAIGLLANNDDGRFPEFAGKDLAALGMDLVRLDRAGDNHRNLAAGADLCTCAGEACASVAAGWPTIDGASTCLDTTSEAETTVVVSLGAGDLLGGLVRLVVDEALRTDSASIARDVRANARAVLALAQDTRLFPHRPRVLVVNNVDPTDGTGAVDDLARGLGLPIQNLGELLPPPLVLGVYRAVELALAEEAHSIDATTIDAAAHFLGHGARYADPANPHHDPADPTPWIRAPFDPNRRGAHELRRLLYEALSGEAIATLPAALVEDLPPGLPAVPDHRWAKTIVRSAVTTSIPAAGQDEPWPNGSADPTAALGPPDGGDGTVALGVRGAYLVVDLGAPVVDAAGPDLVVLEQGLMTGGVPEPYRVSVATAADGPFVAIADGRGEMAFDLAEAAVSSARYVRLDSLATAADIFAGTSGSILAPGPEIDAVGAVR